MLDFGNDSKCTVLHVGRWDNVTHIMRYFGTGLNSREFMFMVTILVRVGLGLTYH